MAVFKRWNGTSWEIIGPTISNSRVNTVEELIAPEYDPNSPYSVGDFVVHSDTLYKCNTAIGSGGELWNSAHWTETKIGDEVSDLKSALTDITVIKKKINYIKDYYVNLNYEPGSVVNLTPADGTGWEYAVLDCSEGDQFLINAQGSTIFQHVWGFVDADNKMLTKSTEQNVNGTVIAPQNATKIILNNQTIYTSDSYTITGNNLIEEITDEIETLTIEVDDLKSQINQLDGAQPKKSVVYPYSGYINASGSVVANANFFYSDYIEVEKLDISTKIYTHSIVATFTFYDADKNYLNKYYKRAVAGAGMESVLVDIPSDAVYVIVCTDPTFDNKVYEYTLIGDVLTYGNYGRLDLAYSSATQGITACPCKKTEKGGKLTSIYVKSKTSGTITLYVGAVDQLYLFVPRYSFDLTVAAGAQKIDISDLDKYINVGEQVLIKTISHAPFTSESGTPEGDTSFYYAINGGMQLTVYSEQSAIVFGFGYEVDTSVFTEIGAHIQKNTEDISSVNNDITTIQSNLNIVSDRQGNKYKMIVVNGNLSLIPMVFNHVLCVGNSYTIHPTTTDSGDYATTLWWGHWSMAASSADTAYPTLLQKAIRQKVNNAVVTPVFGRRYEVAPSTYAVDNSASFTYWNGSQWESLKDNVASFTNVDCVVFFLGINATTNDFYNWYNDMINQFLTWFPNAALFCCSCNFNSNPTKDAVIQQIAGEQLATYVNMVGTSGLSRLGAYVKGDDNNLHQINNSAVANHYGDYGEYLICDRLCSAMGYENNTTLHNLNIINVEGVNLSLVSNKSIENAVVSVFVDILSGTLNSITVTDSSNNAVTVTDHGSTDYGRIFTFIMPNSDVTITANMS